MPDVLVAHNEVPSGADPSTRDVLAQVGYVTSGLDRLGVTYRVVGVGDGGVDAELVAGGSTVFNLVESPPGRPDFQVEAAAAFVQFGLAVTGSPPEVIRTTTDKDATRRLLARAGIAVADGGAIDPERAEILDEVPPPWILKPASEDASLGLDAGSVTSDREDAVARAREIQSRFPGQTVLVEHFLGGREFNLSLLAGGPAPEVLPPAELVFVDFPPDRPAIVDWDAKWDEGSFAYQHTVRRFLDPAEHELGAELCELARAAWAACGLSGYGRVDLRLDGDGRPCVLEVNANPCISPDAGFAAAAAEAGIEPSRVVERILSAAGWKR